MKKKVSDKEKLASLRSRRIAPKHRTVPTESKIRVTMWVDADVVRAFQERASEPGTPAYQTQINTVLREFIFGKPSLSLVNDENFIKAVAEKVKALEKIA